MIAGQATAEGTARALARAGAAEGWARPLGRTGLQVSALGFGTYRVGEAAPDHAAALAQALAEGGVDLVDTAVNYGLGAAERVLGRVLARLAEAGRLARDEVVVVGKAGYWQGGLLDELRAGGLPAGARVARMGDDHWHAIDPALLPRAVAASRERAGLATLDVLLLHNPEYLLDPGPGAGAGGWEAGDEDAFYAHVAEAFACLEELAERGWIGAYGVSSNGLALPPGAPRATSAPRFLEAARRAAGDAHRLRVVQLPLNAVERGALAPRGDGPSAVAACAAAGVAVLANRPLNALADGALVRLADPGPTEAADDLAGARRALAAVERSLGVTGEGGAFPRWSSELPRGLARLGCAADFDDFRARYADPLSARALDALRADPRDPAGARRVEAARAAWRQAFERLARAARAQLARRDALRLAPVAAALDAELPPGLRDAPLATRAAAWVATRPGVTAALVGMRRPRYVTAMTALRASPLPSPPARR